MATKMNPDVKTKWVEALRSGEYRQTKHKLHTKRGGFCCLGVLCEVAIKEGLDVKKNAGSDRYFYDHEEFTLPSRVQAWAGLDVDHEAGWHRLADMNDGYVEGVKGDFPEIADWIDENL